MDKKELREQFNNDLEKLVDTAKELSLLYAPLDNQQDAREYWKEAKRIEDDLKKVVEKMEKLDKKRIKYENQIKKLQEKILPIVEEEMEGKLMDYEMIAGLDDIKNKMHVRFVNKAANAVFAMIDNERKRKEQETPKEEEGTTE